MKGFNSLNVKWYIYNIYIYLFFNIIRFSLYIYLSEHKNISTKAIEKISTIKKLNTRSNGLERFICWKVSCCVCTTGVLEKNFFSPSLSLSFSNSSSFSLYYKRRNSILCLTVVSRVSPSLTKTQTKKSMRNAIKILEKEHQREI